MQNVVIIFVITQKVLLITIHSLLTVRFVNLCGCQQRLTIEV